MKIKTEENLKLLAKHVSEEDTEELLSLVEKYEKYNIKFCKKVNKILNKKGYEVRTGMVFDLKQ